MAAPIKQPKAVLALLLAVNLLNYVDRQVLYAVFPLVKESFNLSDTALGALGSAFMFCYMLAAPVMGWFGDRLARPRLAGAGLAIWSLATAMAGLAGSYAQLLVARTAVGIGEASFGTVSPGLVADQVEPARRARTLAVFYLAIPVGSAIGYLLGGVVGQHYGWQAAFLLVGLPGLLLVWPVWRMAEPGRRDSDGQRPQPSRADYQTLAKNRSYLLTTLAMAAMTFALGGLAQWLPSFFVRVHGLDVARSNTLFGGITVLAGILGSLAGGWLGDAWQRRHPGGQLLVSASGFVLGIPAAVLAILTPSLPTALGATFVAELCLFLNTGPLNTVLVQVSRPTVRAMAFAANIFFIHALGDAISPTVIGWLSDRYGLRLAMLTAPLAVALAAGFCLLAARTIRHDLVEEEPA